MAKLEKGYIQIYTGNGKGKTTAALGLAFRAVGDGMKVIMVQFLKSNKTGELNSSEFYAPNFKIYRFEKRRGFVWTLNDQEKLELKSEIMEAYSFVKEVIKERKCDILILDEVMAVIYNNFLEVSMVTDLIDSKPEDMELILTGRNAPKELIERADLVTEMKDIKHYYEKGVAAREGIEY
ncbi:cob(I)yrinic acid a,c-diamide adenosyltransferase [Clostridium folliculivorans]|uniref:Cob(I)alamin adenosyltransferase/cobinamide ATP-dependent adenosyltransferase n=1 Tax=Clostridium folliculivorans TaxID=2886038 RepID=A0A9W5XZK2_9CLOT|nr:cob(I)yrinic acid a,c-diamide adenosyltransferase [Clostridium folliculivorans]GKU23887.1 cob(I)alamin adenosyltransferase/cobinamide ATP-dependent adenosyltransferase [Clostridium folliculivorans]GKU30003.1 cob(I)alamin adenosyltransferase/cobinamide ATP-dependent adenosyltransferase [Clostridium folliculivorans]